MYTGTTITDQRAQKRHLSITAFRRSEFSLKAIVCSPKSKSQKEESKDKWASVSEGVTTSPVD